MQRLPRLAASLLLLLAPAFGRNGLEISQAAGLCQRFRRRHRRAKPRRTGRLRGPRGTGNYRATRLRDHQIARRASPLKMSPSISSKHGASARKRKTTAPWSCFPSRDRKIAHGSRRRSRRRHSRRHGRHCCSMTCAPRCASNQYGAALVSAAVLLGDAIAKDQGVQIPPPQSYRPFAAAPRAVRFPGR